MEENWLDKVFKENYQFVRALKNTKEKSICIYRHKQLGKYIVKRSFVGTGEVYYILRKFNHPNISQIYDVIRDNDKIIVLEEFINGETISEYLESDLFSPDGVVKIISSLCDALDFLHSHKIIHKDIKPENVMIDNNGNVKLIDFDSSRVYKPFKSNDTVFMGTIGYAPPEQYGMNCTDERSDIYALGVLMNVMLTGKVPESKLYDGKFRKIIEKCTQTVPNNRYQNVKQIKRVLKIIKY